MSQDAIIVGLCLAFALCIFALALGYNVVGRLAAGRKRVELEIEKK